MDCTQALDDFHFEEPTQFKDGEKKQLGCLEVKGVKYAVFNGENRIGRGAECAISINSKALSKEHAVIEVVDADNHLLYDLGSRNKTRLGKMILQPDVRYQLANGAKLHLADVSAVYRRLPNGPEEDDSGSETGSESMLTLNNTVAEDSVIVPETPGPSKIKQKKPITVQESPSSVSDADSSFGSTGDKQKEKELFVKPKTLLDQSAKEGGEGDSAKTLYPSTGSNKDESKDSIYEADTQCEVTDKTDYDIYDAPTQCILNDTTKSVKVIDNKEDIYNAPTQCFLDDQSKTGTDKTDAISSCSERTEDFTIDENSLSSNEDITNRTEEGGNTTCIEKEKSKEDDKSSAKQELNVSQNDDSFDRSLLEGDDDFFAFEATQVHEKNTKKSSEVKEKIDIKSDKKPIDQVPPSSGSKSNDKKSSEVKDSTSSNQMNSNREQHMNYSRRSDDMFLSQPLNSSLKTSNDPNTSAKTAHSNDSGDETDPEDIFDAPTQPVGQLQKDAKATLNNGNKSPTKGNNDSGDETDPEAIFEAPTQTKESKSEPSTASEAKKIFAVPSITGKGNNDKSKTSVDSKKAEEEDDIFEAATQVIQKPRKDENKLVKSPPKGEVTESSEKRKDVPKISEKGKELPKPTPSEKSVKQKEFSKSPESSDQSKELPKEIDDDIFEAATQIVGTPSKSAFPSGKSPAIDAKKQVPSVSPPTKIENKDNVMEALAQKVEFPTKPSESSVANATVSFLKPSNHVNKDQDKVFKAPAKSKEHENQNLSSTLKKAPGTDIDVPMKASSKDNLDDDIFDLPTQKIDEKLTSNKEIEKESKTEQQDQKTDMAIKTQESNVKKDNESKQAVLSKDSSKTAEDMYSAETQDIYSAETQDIYSAETQDIYDADTQLMDTSEQEDEDEAKLDNKSTKTGVESNDIVLKTQKNSDSSGIKPLNDDSKKTDVKILPCVSPKRPVDSSVTQKEKVPEPATKSPELFKKPQAESSNDQNETNILKDGAETVVSKRSSPLKISDSYVKPVSQVKEIHTESAVASKKVEETKKADVVPPKASEFSTKKDQNKEAKIDVSEKKELEDSEKVVAKKSSTINKIKFSETEENEPTEKSVKSSPNKETSKVPSKKDGKAETCTSIEENKEKKAIEEDDDYIVIAPTQVMRVYEGKVAKRVMIENESECAGKEEKVVKEREETGKAKDKVLSERKEEGKAITEKGKYSSVEKGIGDSSAHTSEEINRAEVEINLNEEGESSEDVKIVEESDGTSDIKSLGFKTPEKKGRSNEDKKQEPKKPYEPAKSCNSNDSMELLLPESQELRDAKEADVATSAQDISVEDIPSYDESSPVVASKRLPIRRARVRKRFELTADEETAASSSSRRNAPEKKSAASESSADVGTRSSRRRKQAEEPVESTLTGVRASKQRKLSAETVKEEEPRESVKAEREKSTDKENEASETPPKRQSRASGSNQAQIGGSTKQASKIPKRERASRNKNEKTEEKKESAGSRRSEGQRTSGRRGQAQADTPNVKERSTRESRNAKKLEDVENVPKASSRPSRERKMTWKVRESLSDSSQGSIGLEDDKSKSRSRGSSSNNSRSSSSQDLSVGRSSRSRTSTPLKKVKVVETEVPATKQTTRKSASSVKGDASEENKAAQTLTKAQKRKNKEDAAETPVKRSRREEQSHSEDSKEPDTRISGRRSKQQAEGKVVTGTGASRSTRRKPEAAVTSPSCLKELNTSAVSGSSARQQRGSKRANISIEDEVPPAKQRKQEKKPLKETPKEVVARSSRTRGKGSPQKQSAAETAVTESPKPAQRARTSRSLKTEEEKEDKTESLTPKNAPQRSRAMRGKGTPQGINQSNVEGSSPRRATPRKTAAASRMTYQVMFTGFSDAKQEAIVKQLGGSVVDVPDSCTVLVTDKVRRTYKFLCTVGRGKPIVSPEWLLQCRRSGSFIDPWQYVVKDQESETKFNFHLQESLELATRTNLLTGYSVHVTAKVKPPPSEMKGIIESCGGTYMAQAPAKSWPANSFTISCAEDKASWTKLKKSGKPIVGPEALLLGVLQQKLDLKSNTLV